MNWTERVDLLKKQFPDLDAEGIDQFISSGTHLHIKSGEYLFHQNEDSHEMYMVINGRFRAIQESESEKKILGDIGPGETLGELAFFSDEKRMASVLAIRDSQVIRFTPTAYLTLMANNPGMAKSLFNLVIKRLRRNTFDKQRSTPPKNIALIRLDKNIEFNSVLEEMTKYFNSDGIELQSHRSSTLQDLDKDLFFSKLEDNHAVNFLMGDEDDIEWAKQCKLYADLIIVLAQFDDNSSLYQIEEDLSLYGNDILNKKTYLLLLHDQVDELPKGTKAWLSERNVDMHIHLRRKKVGDIHRFCRILSHKAVGLVLGGGGAKGFAHIGVVKALKEKNIPIDFLGGTSAGALYGIGMSFLDFDSEKIHDRNKEGVRRKMTSGELTIPLFSLLKGRKFKRYLMELFGEYGLEDIWTLSYCVTTNYSTATNNVHFRGKLWRKVLASMSIPGIFPPVVIDHQLHVDGGVMDNLPVEAMYTFPVDRIIAVSLSSDTVKNVNFSEMPGTLTMLKDKMVGRKKYRLPGILSMIINSMVINSKQKEMNYKEQVSDYIALELKGVSMLDDKAWKSTIEKGYKQMKTYLDTV